MPMNECHRLYSLDSGLKSTRGVYVVTNTKGDLRTSRRRGRKDSIAQCARRCAVCANDFLSMIFVHFPDIRICAHPQLKFFELQLMSDSSWSPSKYQHLAPSAKCWYLEGLQLDIQLFISKIPCLKFISWSCSNFNWWVTLVEVIPNINIWRLAPNVDIWKDFN